jgi:hypothetical protein
VAEPRSPCHVAAYRADPLYPRVERAVNALLAQGNVVKPVLRYHAHDLNLQPSATVYERHGKGAGQRLRFTRSGDARLEEAYATHFVWPGNGPFHPPTAKETRR